MRLGGLVLSSGDNEVAEGIVRAGVPGREQDTAARADILAHPAVKAGPQVHLPAHRILSHRVPRRPLLLVEGRCRRCRHSRLNAWAAHVFDWSRAGMCWTRPLADEAAYGHRGQGSANAA